MIIIVALDDNSGMMFNERRQSMDRVLRERILSLVSEGRLLMNRYTESQFEPDERIVADDDFLENAKDGDFCFVENEHIAPYENKIKKIVIFRWNRKYPGDFFFDIDLSTWTLSDTEEFRGSSHDKITMEVYIR